MIAIINYGLGNVNAFSNILKDLSCKYKVVQSYKELLLSDKIILPGVGSYDWALSLLNKSGMRDALDEMVLIKKKQILGVCIGMQIMSKNSEEGVKRGLDWLDVPVKKFKKNKNLLVPHIGWNSVEITKKCDLMKGIEDPQFYFLHSYYLDAQESEITSANTFYGQSFTSVIQNENIFGTQFHPEKSHSWGIQTIKNFVNL